MATMTRARLLQLAAVAASLVAASGCATMTASSHVQSGLDVSKYRTYDWGPPDALPTGDPRLDKDPFFKDHVLGAIEKQMAANGFERATGGTPDVLIHYHASISERIDVNRVDLQQGYCYDVDCLPSGVSYEAGTLVVDMVDTQTKRVIWRGWARDSIEEALRDRDKMAREIDEAVTRMFARFPRPL